MRERLDVEAAKVGITRNALVVRCLARMLGMPVAGTEETAPAASSPGCPHPKPAEQKVTSANGKSVILVRCGECGARVR